MILQRQMMRDQMSDACDALVGELIIWCDRHRFVRLLCAQPITDVRLLRIKQSGLLLARISCLTTLKSAYLSLLVAAKTVKFE